MSSGPPRRRHSRLSRLLGSVHLIHRRSALNMLSPRQIVSNVEGFFDQIKLGYKWRFGRWNELRVIIYRGYGTPDRLYVKGRVLDDKGTTLGNRPASVWQNIANTFRRIETDEIPGARVRLRFQDQQHELETDGNGFFEADVAPDRPLPDDQAWHEVEVELLSPDVEAQDPVRSTGQLLVPQAGAEFGVISDLDDTLVRTGATNAFRQVRTTLLNSARTRVPFVGVAAFYRALQRGPDDKGVNPIFYVSSSPWNFYDLFEGFMEAHDVPAGPIFLKDFGFTKDKFFKSGHQEHKLERIRQLLEIYPELPFVLIGDSGQQDPETYRQIAGEMPERIRAVYVRDVTPPKRDREVRKMAEAVEAEGTPFVLAQDTEEAADHAHRHGLITEDALEDVRAGKEREQAKEPGLLERLLG